MATSGTYAFSPEIAEFVDDAFERCGLDPATLTGRHVRSARRSMDFLFSEWANHGVHLWAVDQQTQALTASDGEYNAASGTVALLEVIVRRSGVDTPVEPMARDEYMAIPDKDMEGLPSRFYFDRSRTTPTIALWPVPENSTDTLLYYRMRQLQDTGGSSYTPDIPYRWNEALVSGLAAKLAEKYAPEREQALAAKARAQLLLAKQEDRERTPTNTRVNYNVGLRNR